MINRKYGYLVLTILAVGLTTTLLIQAQQHDGSMSHQQMEEMNKRGDKAMGFDHLKTTHHFLLANDGGSIQVEANDANDIESRDQIRGHLRHITVMFGEGKFDVPMLIHEKTPPGSEVMQRLKSEITYKFKETERGAAISISTSNAEAMRAIHEFLRFQIKEHKTGDPMEAPGV